MYLPLSPTPALSVNDIATRVDGKVLSNSDTPISYLCPLNEPRAGGIAFANRKALSKLDVGASDSAPSCLLIPEDYDYSELPDSIGLIGCEDPQRAFLSLVPAFFRKLSPAPGVDSSAQVAPDIIIGENSHIGAFCSIAEGVTIGSGVTIHPHVTIYPGVEIGDNSIIHAGAVIRELVKVGRNCEIHAGVVLGSDGFGYKPEPGKGLVAVPQLGSVVLADGVDVGANTCIDRGALGDTTISLGTKIDNQVQIGHNVKIGAHTILCGHASIAGSASIGNQVILAGKAGVADHVTIADGCRVASNAGVDRDITEAGDYRGFPIEKDMTWRRKEALARKLPELWKRVKSLEKSISK